ncbi:hypothetical protein LUZ62_019369 [Rhynchospora pubera]|uniref:Neprosin PEP catalytic domain-containing protein n=1 Tax=Rhynchospora pubera TaxID=906938 RepID=A0AAV8GME3_9POAL|nr:hypothetical protein LUZ62_019369 [Rhynchospora pubera]
MGEKGSVMKTSVILVIFLVLEMNASIGVGGELGKKDIGIEKRVRMLNKPYVTSFKTEGRGLFDCVEIRKQPAFDHPLLKHHIFQLIPSLALKESWNISETPEVKSLKGCPEGTVPIMRTSKEDLLRARNIAPVYMTKSTAPYDGNLYSMALIHEKNQRYYGAEALMDVYNISDIKDDQISSAEIILTKGDGGPRNYLNTIQFGWEVNYDLYGDYNTRLFVFWTSDGYQKGCSNTLCPGWVQTSKRFSPGMILPTGKSIVKLSLRRDPARLDWWIAISMNGFNDELMGYFPHEIFNNLADSDKIEVGGIVYSPSNEKIAPPMGSGVRPNTFGGACEFKQVAYMSGNGIFHPPADSSVETFNSNPNLYGIQPGNQGGNNGYVFSFGGPGGFNG